MGVKEGVWPENDVKCGLYTCNDPRNAWKWPRFTRLPSHKGRRIAVPRLDTRLENGRRFFSPAFTERSVGSRARLSPADGDDRVRRPGPSADTIPVHVLIRLVSDLPNAGPASGTPVRAE